MATTGEVTIISVTDDETDDAHDRYLRRAEYHEVPKPVLFHELYAPCHSVLQVLVRDSQAAFLGSGSINSETGLRARLIAWLLKLGIESSESSYTSTSLSSQVMPNDLCTLILQYLCPLTALRFGYSILYCLDTAEWIRTPTGSPNTLHVRRMLHMHEIVMQYTEFEQHRAEGIMMTTMTQIQDGLALKSNSSFQKLLFQSTHGETHGEPMPVQTLFGIDSILIQYCNVMTQGMHLSWHELLYMSHHIGGMLFGLKWSLNGLHGDKPFNYMFYHKDSGELYHETWTVLLGFIHDLARTLCDSSLLHNCSLIRLDDTNNNWPYQNRLKRSLLIRPSPTTQFSVSCCGSKGQARALNGDAQRRESSIWLLGCRQVGQFYSFQSERVADWSRAIQSRLHVELPELIHFFNWCRIQPGMGITPESIQKDLGL